MTVQIGDGAANPVFTDVTATGTPGALNATVSATLRGQACATVQVTAIGSLTLTFEGTTDGVNFDPVLGTPIAGGTPVSTTTANGHWVNFNTAGLAVFRARVSAFTSGTATVTIVASQGSALPNFTAGGLSKIDLASENGTALGTPTNFGTTPTAVAVIGANASLFAGTVSVPSGTLGTSPGAVTGTIPTNSSLILGTTIARSNQTTTATGALDVNVVGLIGVTAVAASAGVIKTGISGATGVTIDAAAPGTIPANAILVGGRASNANPTSATNGQLQTPLLDLSGRVITTPLNYRTLISHVGQTISVNTISTLVAAGAAGVFRDITQIIITTSGAAAQTLTFTDGTVSFILDYPTNTPVAVNAFVPPFVMSFVDVPLRASSAATAWQVTQSLATTCHYLVQFVERIA